MYLAAVEQTARPATNNKSLNGLKASICTLLAPSNHSFLDSEDFRISSFWRWGCWNFIYSCYSPRDLSLRNMQKLTSFWRCSLQPPVRTTEPKTQNTYKESGSQLLYIMATAAHSSERLPSVQPRIGILGFGGTGSERSSGNSNNRSSLQIPWKDRTL